MLIDVNVICLIFRTVKKKERFVKSSNLYVFIIKYFFLVVIENFWLLKAIKLVVYKIFCPLSPQFKTISLFDNISKDTPPKKTA